jgi:hypothetical protein
MEFYMVKAWSFFQQFVSPSPLEGRREGSPKISFLLLINQGFTFSSSVRTFFLFDKPKASTFRANLDIFRVVEQFAVTIALNAQEHTVFFRIKMVIHVNSHFSLLVFLLPYGLAIAYSSKLDSQ